MLLPNAQLVMAHVRIRSLIAGRLWKCEDRLYCDRVGDAPMTALAKGLRAIKD